MAERRPVVGFVGLGRMGLPMSRNLLKAGFPLLVYNRTAAKADVLRGDGARIMESPGAVAAAADVICVCLDRVEASREVFLGGGGVAHSARPTAIAIDHGTIGPDLAVEIAAGLGARGIGFLDAPVSGGPEGAERAALTMMVGGAVETFERALPVLRANGRTIVRTGPVGTGSLTKLVNQLLTFVHGAVAAEALSLAERTGLDLTALGGVLKESFGQSRMLERTLGRVLAGDYHAGAALRLYAKDLELVSMAGGQVGARLPFTRLAGDILGEADSSGLADRDIAGLIALFRDDTGELSRPSGANRPGKA